MIDRRLLQNFDWLLFITAIFITLIGVMTIYSATRPVAGSGYQIFYLKQLYWLCLSIAGFLVVVMINYMWFIRFAYILYFLGIILLLAVFFLGKEIMGAQRWISLGFFSFQPSELFKILFILCFAHYLSLKKEGSELELNSIVKIFVVFFVIPAILILKQPDLGTVVMIFLIFTSMVLTAGVRRKIVIIAIIIGLISIPFVGNIIWGGLEEYQRERIIAFVNPYVDSQGVGYHITQSKVSIGSGGFWGKGYLKGTQGPLRFLPERHTDFIFSVFAEEWGFAGSVVLFLLFLLIILRGFDTAKKARDASGRYIAIGITYMLFFYFIINVGMTIGVVPVVGVPLPFMSYGGTALMTNFIALGFLVNVRMRRYSLFY
jgi:rod shape determining protein RodA